MLKTDFIHLKEVQGKADGIRSVIDVVIKHICLKEVQQKSCFNDLQKNTIYFPAGTTLTLRIEPVVIADSVSL